MLNMTYMKYIESDLLCFIPGKVLDEMRTILALVETDKSPPRTHQLLQELRDLSSMAMEHFDEHILPKVKENLTRRSALTFGGESFVVKSPKLIYAQHTLTSELHKVKKQSKSHKHHISLLTESTQKLYQKIKRQNMRLKSQYLKIREQQKKIQDQNTKIQEQEATLADIKKHIDEWDQKYKDLTRELVKARDDILSATVHKPTTATSLATTPKFYESNIKPRTTHILPKSYLGVQFDLDRKRKSNLLPEIPLKRNKPPENIENASEKIDLIDISKKEEPTPETSSKFTKNDIGSIISSSLENLLKNPLMNIKSRKRKMPEDIDLK